MLLHPSPGLCFLSFSQRQTPDPGNETLSKELKAKGKDATQWLKDGWFVRKTKWECMTCGESTAYPWGIFATHATLLGTRISRLKACLSRWWFSELRVWWGPWIRETWGYTIQVLWFQIGWKKTLQIHPNLWQVDLLGLWGWQAQEWIKNHQTS